MKKKLKATVICLLGIILFNSCQQTSETPSEQKSVLKTISVKNNPLKTSYVIGESSDYTGLSITATYTDLSTKEIVYSEETAEYFSFKGFNTDSSSESLLITVIYTENNYSAEATFVINVNEVKKEKVATPVITVNKNIVTIICSTDSANIYYTIDNTLPSSNSSNSILYEKEFEIVNSVTVKAIGVKDDYDDSEIAIKECSYFAPKYAGQPIITFSDNVVSIEMGENTDSIYYTTDGTIPSITNGKKYLTSFSIENTLTVKAIGIGKEGYENSVMSLLECVYVEPVTIHDLESLGAYTVLSDYESSSSPQTGSWTYVSFGTFPQTIKSDTVTIDVNQTITQGGQTYFLGSDGYYYAKLTAIGYGSAGHFFSDGVTSVDKGTEYYFKVEPIIWRVLTDNFNYSSSEENKGKLLLSEKVLYGMPFYSGTTEERTVGNWYSGTTYYRSNYETSNIRAFLNGINNQFVTNGGTATKDDKDYTDIGFWNIAFTENQQKLITTTIVDNSKETTTDANGKITKSEYCSKNTEDKVFLLSVLDVTNIDYGFTTTYDSYGSTTARIKPQTDYAFAFGDEKEWLLRSPANSKTSVHYVGQNGDVSYNGATASDGGHGTLPAICVKN